VSATCGFRPGARELASLLALLVLFLAGIGIAISAGNVFGYDESVYALLSRNWIAHTPASGWDVHRSPLLSIIGLVPALPGGSVEWPFRMVSALFAMGMFVASWALARATAGAIAGVIVGLVLASSTALEIEGASFLTDIPSTALLLGLTALLWRQLAAESISYTIVWLAPLAAASFYMRYGAIIPLAGLAIASIAVGGRKLWVARRPVLAMSALFLGLLGPHLVQATAATGVPWGIIGRAQGAASGAGPLPLWQYLGWFPSALLGPLGATVAVIGVGWILATTGFQLTRGDPDGRARLAIFVGATVLVNVAVFGTVIHAEIRYVFFPMILLVITGAACVSRNLRWIKLPRLGRGALATLATFVALGLVGSAVIATSQESFKRTAAFGWKREAGFLIGERSNERGCSVVAADVPILSWYSGCRAVGFAVGTGTSQLPTLTSVHRYVVYRADGQLQPTRQFFEQAYLPHLRVLRTYVDPYGRVVASVYEVQP
jgi:4-amino-4-deoxy-L-arabinose transferase-like glycosyltransferase